MERKLVTVRIVEDVVPIEGADAIELVKIDGWQVVAKKGEFHPKDPCVYFEIDSFIDTDIPQFNFLEKNKIKWNGKEGARIRTIKLRGQISQGLALPLSAFPGLIAWADAELGTAQGNYNPENGAGYLDLDYSDFFGVVKWEPMIPAHLAGRVKGNFPSFIRKTDQERLQNMWRDVTEKHGPDTYEVTVKLDGSSMTVYRHNGVFGVCSRNLDLAETDDNAFWKTARNLDIENKLKDLCLDNIAIQGELMGPGVQGNHEGLTELDFFVFDIFNIASQEYLSPAARQIVTHSLKLNHAPIIGNAEFKFENIDQALEFAEGPSLKNPKREGVVFKSDTNPNFSFKIIANSYLLAHADR